MPYIPQTLACTVPNSADPVTAQAIAAAQANTAAMDAQANTALAAWMALLDRTPADFADLYIAPSQFIQPQTAAQLLGLPGASSVTPGAPAGSPGSAAGSMSPYLGPFATAKDVAAFRASKVCRIDPSLAPVVLPIQGGFPSIPVVVPLTTPPLQQPPPPPAAAPAPARPTQAQCRTQNICADLRSGCVQARQVDPQQLLLCAMRGWSGNQNRFPWLAADPTLPYLGMVDSNPPQASGMSGAAPRGLGCADCGGTCGSKKPACGACNGMGDVTAPDVGSLVFGGLAVFAVTYWTLKQFYGKKGR